MCLLPLIAGLCLADPANLSVIADASIQTGGNFSYYAEGRQFGGGHVGRFGLEMQAPIASSVTLRYGWEHLSLLDTGRDRGQERIYVGFTFRPFARSSTL